MVYSLIYGSLLLGLWVLFSDSFVVLLRQSRANYHIQRQTERHASPRKTAEQWLRQTLLALGCPPAQISFSRWLFYMASAGLGIAAFILFSLRVSLLFGVVVGLIALVTPAALLLLRLQKLRIDSSYEGEILIHEFSTQYKLQYRNVIEALEQTAANLPEAPLTATGLIRLCQRLREVRIDEDVCAAFDDFVFRIGTEWAKKFALSLTAGLQDQVILDESLADLTDEIGKARKVLEQGKRVNNESAIIIKYMALPMYLLCMIWGSQYMGSSAREAFHNQFATSTGLQYFAFIVITYAVSVALLLLFDSQKMDLD